MHDRVTHKDNFQNQRRIDRGVDGDLLGQFIDCLTHRVGHFSVAPGVHHHIADPAHQVFAKANLRVHDPGGCDRLTGFEMGQVHRHRG